MARPDELEAIERLVAGVARRTLAEGRLDAAPAGLRDREVEVLAAIRAQGPARMGVLAEATSLPLSTLTGIVERLVRLRFVRREQPKGDRRGVEVSLLPRGEKWLSSGRRPHREVARALLDPLTDEEREVFSWLVGKILQRWEGERAP